MNAVATLRSPRLAAAPPDGPASLSFAAPSVAEIARVVALPDLVLRNLLVTQRYHELSSAMAEAIGPAANWCTFAVWASKQAGQTIREEDLRRLLERELATAPEMAGALDEVATAAARFGSRLDPLALRAAATRALARAVGLEQASLAISRGNTKVFETIAAECARFLAACGDDDAFDAERIAAFTDRLRPGLPPTGQGYLRRAFFHLYQARCERSPRTRAELIHLANLEIGVHEQTRLQPEIEEALDAALPDPEELRRRLFTALFPAPDARVGLRLRLASRLPPLTPHSRLLEEALDRLIETLRTLVRRAVTAALMRLELPTGEVLRLGRDLPRRFPSSLAAVTHPELRELLARLDPTPDSPRGTGTEDWADFGQRMHYIADLFRCLAEEAALFDPPFTPEQVAALEAGRRPSGKL
jgi:hypothetical protein